MSKEHRYFFNDIAETWQKKTSWHSLRKCMMQFGVLPADIVLDIGAGTGALTAPLVQLIKSGRVVAADISERMLQEMRNNNISLDRVLLSCSDACNLAFTGAIFDKIVCYSAFPHIQKPQRALSEFYRVLKPGGRIVVFHNCCSRKLNHLHARIPAVCFDKLPKSEYLQALMVGAGFKEIKTIEQPDLYWVEAGKDR